MTTTPDATPLVDLDELARFVTDAAICGKDRVSLPRAEFAALIAEARALRAVKQQVRQQAFADVAAWLGSTASPWLDFAAGHVRCNVNDPGAPGDGSCRSLPATDSQPAQDGERR